MVRFGGCDGSRFVASIEFVETAFSSDSPERSRGRELLVATAAAVHEIGVCNVRAHS